MVRSKRKANTGQPQDNSTSIASLEDEQMLTQVLRHLNSLKDVARCSAVSRSWHAASQAVQLLSIAVDSDRQLTSDKAATVLQQLQRCEARGMFRQLHQMYLAVGAYSPQFFQQQGSPKSFFLSMIKIVSSGPQLANLSSSWPLTTCHLSGVFPFIPAMRCLPVTVEHVILEPTSKAWPGCVYLRTFDRFVNLQTLEIRPKHFLAHRQRTRFHLDCVLASLQPIYLLDSCELAVYSDFSFGTSLPALRHFGAALNSFNACALLAKTEVCSVACHKCKVDTIFDGAVQ